MSLAYRAVDWNRQKRVYDALLVASVSGALGAFAAVTAWRSPDITAETLVIRGTALVAIGLLHVVLAIGPLARLDRRFLPWLYNRRHLGVTLFLVALVHGAFSVVQFHALGDANPLASVFTAYDADFAPVRAGAWNLANLPFEPFGAAALAVLFVMAATSHDFWLRNLGAAVWKTLHVGVYAAYGLVLAHVAFGVVQAERAWTPVVLLGAGFVALAGLHVAAARRETRADVARQADNAEWSDACGTDEIPEGQARVVGAGGKRVALFRHEGRVFATSNVCRHQGGPLGEGRVVDGCITCPWHGWNYKVEDGCSPPPFKEVVATHDTRLEAGRVQVRATPNPPGTRCPGTVVVGTTGAVRAGGEFYVGYDDRTSEGLARHIRRRFTIGLGVFVAAMVAVALSLQKADPGRFEYGTPREFTGVFMEFPLPRLRMVGADGVATNLVLVGAGKHGLPTYASGHDGEMVSLMGTLIERGGVRMVELGDAGSVRFAGRATSVPATGRTEDLGRVAFDGELVDTKCWLGVMRPATGKVHRACAVRCLSGGVPPGLLLRDGDGNGAVVFLVGPSGRRLDFDPQWGGRQIGVKGGLQLVDGTAVLRVDLMQLGR